MFFMIFGLEEFCLTAMQNLYAFFKNIATYELCQLIFPKFHQQVENTHIALIKYFFNYFIIKRATRWILITLSCLSYNLKKNASRYL